MIEAPGHDLVRERRKFIEPGGPIISTARREMERVGERRDSNINTPYQAIHATNPFCLLDFENESASLGRNGIASAF